VLTLQAMGLGGLYLSRLMFISRAVFTG
jgi:hypothetical protein